MLHDHHVNPASNPFGHGRYFFFDGREGIDVECATGSQRALGYLTLAQSCGEQRNGLSLSHTHTHAQPLLCLFLPESPARFI
jgi:hypothetical protein